MFGANKKISLIIFLIVVAGLLIKATFSLNSDVKQVYVTQIQKRTINRIIHCEGIIKERLRINISSKIIGQVEEIYHDEGDLVNKNDKLLQLDRRQYEIAVKKAVSNFEVSISQMERDSLSLINSKINYLRAKQLFEKSLISEYDYNLRELDYKLAENTFKIAQQRNLQAMENLLDMEDALDKTLIKAPTSGIILRKFVEIGETAIPGTMNNPGSILLILSNIDTLYIEIDVNEIDIDEVKPGQPVDVIIEAFEDSTFTATISKIYPYPYTTEGQTYYKVLAILHSSLLEIKTGMSAKVEILVDKKSQVQSLPMDVILTEEQKNAESKNYIFLVSKDGLAKKQVVKTGINDLNYIQIFEAIDSAEKVISGPYKTLKELSLGDWVEVISEADESSNRKYNSGDTKP